jgi:hypothetical protein
MKAIKLINLFIWVLFCQVVFAQNNDIIKSFNLRMDKSVHRTLCSAKAPAFVELKARPSLGEGSYARRSVHATSC